MKLILWHTLLISKLDRNQYICACVWWMCSCVPKFYARYNSAIYILRSSQLISILFKVEHGKICHLIKNKFTWQRLLVIFPFLILLNGDDIYYMEWRTERRKLPVSITFGANIEYIPTNHFGENRILFFLRRHFYCFTHERPKQKNNNK